MSQISMKAAVIKNLHDQGSQCSPPPTTSGSCVQLKLEIHLKYKSMQRQSWRVFESPVMLTTNLTGMLDVMDTSAHT